MNTEEIPRELRILVDEAVGALEQARTFDAEAARHRERSHALMRGLSARGVSARRIARMIGYSHTGVLRIVGTDRDRPRTRDVPNAEKLSNVPERSIAGRRSSLANPQLLPRSPRANQQRRASPNAERSHPTR
jgi:hypothetical protein